MDIVSTHCTEWSKYPRAPDASTPALICLQGYAALLSSAPQAYACAPSPTYLRLLLSPLQRWTRALRLSAYNHNPSPPLSAYNHISERTPVFTIQHCRLQRLPPHLQWDHMNGLVIHKDNSRRTNMIKQHQKPHHGARYRISEDACRYHHSRLSIRRTMRRGASQSIGQASRTGVPMGQLGQIT